MSSQTDYKADDPGPLPGWFYVLVFLVFLAGVVYAIGKNKGWF